MSSPFFRMPRGDALYLIVLLAFSVVAFLPWSSQRGWLGLAWLGWMMAALMVLGPVIALIRILLERKGAA